MVGGSACRGVLDDLRQPGNGRGASRPARAPAGDRRDVSLRRDRRLRRRPARAKRRSPPWCAGGSPTSCITTGDNNYPDGAAATIDANIGQYYASFIGPYKGLFGAGAAANAFFPALGNHDWQTPGRARPTWTTSRSPATSATTTSSAATCTSSRWTATPTSPTASPALGAGRLAARPAGGVDGALEVVYFHHPPFSSGPHGSYRLDAVAVREWGAHVVLAGHDHIYERFNKAGVVYTVNGLGGDERYAFGAPRPDSVARYNAAQGAQLVEADASTMRLSFYDTRGVLLDSVTLPDTAVSARGQAWNDAANNYYTLSGAQSFTWRRIYIDTDNTTATGFQAGGVGGDYLIENRWLYRHRGGGWQWTPLTSLTLVATPDGLAWTVPRAAIGQTTSPNTDALSFEVEVPGFQNLGRTEHVYTVVAAAITDTSADNDDASVRYRAIFGSPFSYKHAFVDADTNPSTGFGYAGIGADYLVENTGLYRHVGPGWTGPGSEASRR